MWRLTRPTALNKNGLIDSPRLRVQGGRMDGYGKRILVVAEDAGRRARLEVQLEQEGYAVQMASNGVAGADEMRTTL